MALQAPAISDGQMNTIRPAGFGGLCQLAVSTTATAFDLSAWQNQLIRITVEGGDAYFLFAESSSATIDPTITSTTSAATPNAGIPGLVPQGALYDCAVPVTSNTSSRTYLATGKVFLLVRAKTGTVDVRIHRA